MDKWKEKELEEAFQRMYGMKETDTYTNERARIENRDLAADKLDIDE